MDDIEIEVMVFAKGESIFHLSGFAGLRRFYLLSPNSSLYCSHAPARAAASWSW